MGGLRGLRCTVRKFITSSAVTSLPREIHGSNMEVSIGHEILPRNETVVPAVECLHVRTKNSKAFVGSPIIISV